MSDEWVARRTGVTPTAPPRERYSSRTLLDDASRPTVEEPGDDVLLRGDGSGAGRQLVQMHDHYRAEMARVRDMLAQVRAGARQVGDARNEINMMTIRANDWTLGGYCQAQCLQLTQHHLIETDAIFPFLSSRQPDLAAVIARLNSEHLVIRELLEAVDAALVDLVSHPTEFDAITDAVDLLSDTLLSHFAYEERELLAPLSRYGSYPGEV